MEVVKGARAFLASTYLNLLRKDVYKAYQANEGEISASWGVEALSFVSPASCSAKRSVSRLGRVTVPMSKCSHK
jgi:hypothetical protein